MFSSFCASPLYTSPPSLLTLVTSASAGKSVQAGQSLGGPSRNQSPAWPRRRAPPPFTPRDCTALTRRRGANFLPGASGCLALLPPPSSASPAGRKAALTESAARARRSRPANPHLARVAAGARERFARRMNLSGLAAAGETMAGVPPSRPPPPNPACLRIADRQTGPTTLPPASRTKVRQYRARKNKAKTVQN